MKKTSPQHRIELFHSN